MRLRLAKILLILSIIGIATPSCKKNQPAVLSYCESLAVNQLASPTPSPTALASPTATVSSSPSADAQPPLGWSEIKRVFIVVLENTDQPAAAAQPFFTSLEKESAVLTNSYGITHPSQPNYIGLVSGDVQGVTTNDEVEVEAQHIGDLLKAKGKTWKAYAEDYPGNCFLDKSNAFYVKRHVPFLSFVNVAESPTECAKVVPSGELDKDVQAGTLPDYSLYIPNNLNNGHDTSVLYADQWLSQRFGPLIKNKAFMDGTLLVITFDESGGGNSNQIHTLLYGAGVKAGTTSSQCYDHYSLLASIEKIFNLGTLNKRDSFAKIIDGIWKTEK
jgi:hypothetical protein